MPWWQHHKRWPGFSINLSIERSLSVRWCLAVGLACGDQRRLTGNGSALEVVLHNDALYKKSTYFLLCTMTFKWLTTTVTDIHCLYNDSTCCRPTLLNGCVHTTFARSHFCPATAFDSWSLPNIRTRFGFCEARDSAGFMNEDATTIT